MSILYKNTVYVLFATVYEYNDSDVFFSYFLQCGTEYLMRRWELKLLADFEILQYLDREIVILYCYGGENLLLYWY